MKSKFLIAAMITALFFSLPIANAQNGAVVGNQQYSIDVATGSYWYEINNCTGESVDIVNGIWQFNDHWVIQNGRISYTSTSHVPSYRLVSSSGVQYTGVYVSNLHISNASLVNGLFVLNYTSVTMLTTAGGSNNSKLLIDAHIIINAQGVLTREFDNIRIVCF